MATNQEVLNQAQNILVQAQAELFFGKLASMGIRPANQEEADQLLAIGSAALTKYPLTTQQGREAKLASCEMLNDTSSLPPENGFSEEAIKCGEVLLGVPKITDAIRVVCAVALS
jgi:hypothetical protein